MSLRWVEADASHRADLSAFCCAYNGEDYQLTIEFYFQDMEFPPDPPNLRVLLGYDEEGLATACAWEYYEPGHEPAMHYIWALARDNRVHGTDYAFRTLEEVLRRCMAINRELGQERGAMVMVDSANYSSIELLRRSGFHPLWREVADDDSDEDPVADETWGISLWF